MPRNDFLWLPQFIVAARMVRHLPRPRHPKPGQRNCRVHDHPDDNRVLPISSVTHGWRLRYPPEPREKWANVPILPFAAGWYSDRGDRDPRRAMGLLIDARSHPSAGAGVESDGVCVGGVVVCLVCTSLAGCDQRCGR